MVAIDIPHISAWAGQQLRLMFVVLTGLRSVSIWCEPLEWGEWWRGIPRDVYNLAGQVLFGFRWSEVTVVWVCSLTLLASGWVYRCTKRAYVELIFLLLGSAFLTLGNVVFMVIWKCQKVWIDVEFITAIANDVVSKFLWFYESCEQGDPSILLPWFESFEFSLPNWSSIHPCFY